MAKTKHKKQVRYTPKQKVRVLACVREYSLGLVAEKTGIGKNTIRNWMKQAGEYYPEGTPGVLRDKQGHFLPGSHVRGVGRPKGSRNRLSANREALQKILGPKKIRRIIASLYKKARAGDTKAAHILLDHGVGKPIQPLEVEQEKVVLVLEFVEDAPDAGKATA